jgi:lipopolysaccharide transport system permease protein
MCRIVRDIGWAANCRRSCALDAFCAVLPPHGRSLALVPAAAWRRHVSTEFDAFREAARPRESHTDAARLACPSGRRVEFTMAVPASNAEKTAATVTNGGGIRERSRPVLVIEPPKGRISLGLRELWEYRELSYFLAWRDIKVRYKQTALGASWAILQPVFAMVVFSLFFGKLGGIPSDGLPYPLWSFAALVPWTFFSQALMQSANSLVMNKGLLRKVYFPRLAIPIGTVLSAAVDFALAFVVLLGLMAFYRVGLTFRSLWVVAFAALAFIAALGTGLWLAAASVRYRDVRYVVPILVQFWLFATPIAYPATLLPERWRAIYALNPMTGVAEGFRWALLGANTRPGPMIVASTMAAFLMLVGGVLYFRRTERTFADIV